MLARLRHIARILKRDVLALWIAGRDPRVPLVAKVLAACVAAYALSPVDLIPDFIPVLGLLDDLLIVPAGIWLAVRSIPVPLMAEFRERAAAVARPAERRGLLIVLALWVGAVALALFLWLELADDVLAKDFGQVEAAQQREADHHQRG
ncbi:uncharacterized membrane protein YkvA (DUF1232 family) [Novosphingobium marinum]|uniref:Uncharacterized membrane protein YkvA (DUF1232 family) n=1 Tax=Novosphingobium marinum TaxID=1514948 RepID=A0A7Y9XTT3_9SPHN|nr:uncharacterized membrane protein YkvA (DUF1232 family) [Novosphingobium marinum]